MSRIALLGSLVLLSACATSSLPTGNGNSLGMKFVPVPISGTHETVEFCIHETRECDIAAFRGTASTSSRAATNVSWRDANAFCRWLTDKEHRNGSLPKHQYYRLPTDHEWSCAAGIGDHEDINATPESKRQRIPSVYPWGSAWPPGNRDGNYFGNEARHLIQDAKPITGLNDGHARACEVMRFKPNALGLYDLGGNVWEWCADEFRPGTDWRVLRGAAWNCSRREALLSSHRTFDPSNYKSDTVGFRIVRARE